MPAVSVQSLTQLEEPIRSHFTRPEVQYIGSTSNCGCDFPWVMFQNGAWPVAEKNDKDDEQDASERLNREALVALLKTIDEESVELYGVWAGDYRVKPHGRETTSIERVLEADFRLKEGGFYEVRLTNTAG